MKTRAKALLLAGVLMITSGGTVELAPAAYAHLYAGPLMYKERVVDDRRLLAYDGRGDGRIVEVLGDLDIARHVAVVVPGAGHNLPNFTTSPSGAAPRRNGVALFTELRRRSPGSEVAVVVWTGYDTPEAVNLDAVRSDRAVDAAPDLVRLTDLLPDNATTSLVCHSYGSVVCGHAAADADADNVVVVGSPGMDSSTAAGLNSEAEIWAARTPDDPIRFVPNIRIAGLGHGTDPVHPDFGAKVFETGSITGHDRYYEPESHSLANIARIVLEQNSEVSRP